MRKIFFTIALSVVALNALANHCTVRGIHPKNTNDYYGDVSCHNAVKPAINVVGRLTIDQSQINGLTTSTGAIFTANTIFNAITITNLASPGVILVRHDTLVKGPITFVHQAGTVCIDGSSMLLSNVINGHVAHC